MAFSRPRSSATNRRSGPTGDRSRKPRRPGSSGSTTSVCTHGSAMFRQSSSSNRTTIASLPNHALQKCQADSHRMVDGRTVTEPDLAIEVSISAHAPGCRPGGVAGGRLVPRYRTGLRAGASSGRPRIPRRSPFSGRAKYVEPGCVVWRELPAEVRGWLVGEDLRPGGS